MNWQDIITRATNFGKKSLGSISSAVEKMFIPKTEEVYVKEKDKPGYWTARPRATESPQNNGERVPMPPLQRPQQTQSPMPQQTQMPKVVQDIIKPVQTMSPQSMGEGPRNPASNKYNITQPVKDAINTASKKFGVPTSLLYDIALQESSFLPDKVNPDAPQLNPVGLFQFTDKTWDEVMNYAKSPQSSLYGVLPDTNRRNPVTNALAAAYLIKYGQLGKWDASEGVWGNYWTPQELEDMGFYDQSVYHTKGVRPSVRLANAP